MVHQKEQIFPVTLDKTSKSSFGICIVRGEVKDSPSSKVSGIFIKDIVPQSPAHTCGKLKVGDRILSINNRDIRNASESQVIDHIRHAGQVIELEVQTFGQSESSVPKSILRQNTINKSKAQTGSGVAYNNDTNFNNDYNNEIKRDKFTSQKRQSLRRGNTQDFEDDDEDIMEISGRMYTDSGYEIDRASAANVKWSDKEKAADSESPDDFGYTMRKIKKRYGKEQGDILKVEISRPPNADLGLALAGHRDRTVMATFIAGVNPNGLFKDKNIKAGDEVLEVNGHVLKNRSHLNATQIFKNVAGEKLVVVVLRKRNFDAFLSVKPLQHFPEMIDETEWLFKQYKNVKTIQVQKVGVCIGIMIIEGKHVEVGNGIFISDLQAESAAEEAGLKVGDLVLAVNKDILVDSNYEQAVDIIKRAKGVLTFIICSLKTEEQIAKEKAEEEKKKAAAAEPPKPADPLTDPVKENKKNAIEIKTQKKPIGVIVVGGKNNHVKTGVVITHIYGDGAIGKDNRLQIFDQILEINGTSLLPAAFNPPSQLTTLKVHQLFNLYYDKINMSVWRCDPSETETFSVDILKKPGKDLGISLAANIKGAVITEIQPGNYPEIDSKLQRGDIITKLNGDSLQDTILEVIYALFRGVTGKCAMEILRPKPSAERT